MNEWHRQTLLKYTFIFVGITSSINTKTRDRPLGNGNPTSIGKALLLNEMATRLIPNHRPYSCIFRVLVAQWLKRLAYIQRVVGSSQVWSLDIFCVSNGQHGLKGKKGHCKLI